MNILWPDVLNDEMCHAGFFGRRGGVSEGLYASLNVGQGSNDLADNVTENRRLVAEQMSLSGPSHLVSCYQVHGRDVHHVEASPLERPRADAMVTATPGLGLCILTADCVPVLFRDASAGIVGAAHAGWRGAVAGVCEATFEAMCARGASSAKTVAAIGPCITQDSYEVGEEFRTAVLDTSPWAEGLFRDGPSGRPHFDLPGYVSARLAAAGLETIARHDLDTYSGEDAYHSHRRNVHKGLSDYGRNASVIALMR